MIVLGELGLGLLLAVISRPCFQRLVEARLGPLPAGADASTGFRIGRGRLAVATGVIAAIVGMQLLDIAIQARLT